jgi:heptosyltransferase III
MPAMECLRASYTEVWVPSPVVPLIRFAEQVRAISSTGIDLLALPGLEPDAGLLNELRTFDSIVSWYGANRAEFRQTAHNLGLPVEFLKALPDVEAREHAVDFFSRQAGCRPGALPTIECGDGGCENVAVLHPFSGSAKKNWPLTRFRELAAKLRMPVRWCAGPQEDLPDAVRIDNLYELGCWIRSARIYIGNDSGIAHLAAAVGARVVAIFGPTDPAVWAPRGERVRVVCGKLEEITVNEVLDAACSLL